MSSLCVVCEETPVFAWTDTHGIAQCGNCGAPWRLIHYDGKARVDLPPERVALDIPDGRLREFHKSTGGRLSAVGMGLSFPGGYDVARKEDIAKWREFTTKEDRNEKD